MKVIRAAALGCCFGVRRALQTAFNLPDPTVVTILGELVHNEEILERLRRRGFVMVSEAERDRLPLTTPCVLITAHGISQRERRRLEDAGHQVIDTTCPLVRRIHEAARSLEAHGCFVLIIGKRGHVELRGLSGDLVRCEIIGGPGEARTYEAPRLGVICQSTATPAVVQAVLDEIRRRNPDKEILFVPTICRPTLDRQAAVMALLRQAEALVVVGGRHSNNTLELVRLAESQGVPCQLVQGEDDLDLAWYEQFETVGLTAGTSTPDGMIEAVHRRLLAVGAVRRVDAAAQIA